ncbi:MAG: MarR family transcriptional regulator [Bacillaceae bacterium]|mgnify:FL=1|jgi:DNA-binding MarR family transcriptional regulator|uniref:MarR family transcriptional regulator n=1 Tax=Aeribacillus pallidus TaxID=33936 RepID=A0A165W9U1_9BACI|nr:MULTISPECIES: MarR family transcriptional regulator [Aeribacillus]REJ20589.1 MAG: MarR family transcriptional regulator [Bacillaceae bacterium]KZN94789.1 MarR family transcriptional regulator [Aeribacillus pallidus]MDR9792192.1 MarR family transcriptional regulator [Aeribacillus pallidus]MDR9794993.1 MarR family transcriptional regulator [Aeribacillus pallidus]MED1443100.1 MarR family transcriptional regulator [Aeribacillus composti]
MDRKKIDELIERYIKVSFIVTKRAEELVKCEIDPDITNEQHYLLRYIHQKERCTSTELANVFRVNKSAITAMINRLVEKGFVQRIRDEKDRRVIYLALTEKGSNLFASTEERVHKVVGSFITKFSEDEIESFIQTYEKLANVLLELEVES